ncbi:MAG: hypothetical protein SFY32_07980 [Bacteroidota bacterium]|nr:hypothetical protein [Bacteroidota bacterium]
MLGNWYNKILNSNFFVKLFHWEFWNFYVVYGPTIIYYLYLSFRAKSFFWIFASNPGIENAGYVGESKSGILEKIPQTYLPKYCLIYPTIELNKVLIMLNENNIAFPLVAKPDVGERGQGVTIINNQDQLLELISTVKVDYILQEYISFPLELGVFYYQLPKQGGVVSSVVIKEFLKVRGNGYSTLSDLIESYPRARFRKDYLKNKFKNQWNQIIPLDKEIILEHIGNHVRGTTFINGNYLINNQLTELFANISQQIDGFYFGRYDLRCTNEADLYAVKNIKILELNGAGAEPAHIYQPGFSFWEGQKVLLFHWKVMFQISMYNHAQGVAFPKWNQVKEIYKKHRQAIQNLT